MLRYVLKFCLMPQEAKNTKMFYRCYICSPPVDMENVLLCMDISLCINIFKNVKVWFEILSKNQEC